MPLKNFAIALFAVAFVIGAMLMIAAKTHAPPDRNTSVSMIDNSFDLTVIGGAVNADLRITSSRERELQTVNNRDIFQREPLAFDEQTSGLRPAIVLRS